MKLRISKNPYYAVVTACVLIILATASFDIIGTINLFGFTLRLCQAFILIIIALWLLESSKKEIRLPIGSGLLICWIALQFVFAFRSPDFANAIGYFAWLMFDVLLVFGIVQYTNRAFSLQWLLKVYMNSFVWISILGLAQFALYAVGVNFFITQRWTATLARINGFCYEPSYYSTYLLPGFIIYEYLLEKSNTEILSATKIRIGFVVVALALFLSTSRMGWLMMIIWIAVRIVLGMVRFARKGASRNSVLLVFVGGIIALIILCFAIYELRLVDFSFLLNGLGIFGKASYSTTDRLNGLWRCIEIFRDSPWMGYSLGGVDPMISKYSGYSYITGNNGASMSIIGELLVANGIVGMIPFLGYIYSLTFARKKRKSQQKPVIYKAFVWALVFEMAILCMNQNILRIYVWCLIAVLSAVEYQYERDEHI